MTTNGSDLKSEADGWDYGDGDAVHEAAKKYPQADVWEPADFWRISCHCPNFPNSPLHALALCWKLLTAPRKLENGEWEWWFVK